MASDPVSVRKSAHRVIAWQAGIVLFFAIFFGLRAHSFAFGTAVLLGGLCGVFANLYFAWKFLKKMDARAPQKIMQAMITGEVGKLALSAITIILLIVLTPLRPIAIIAGFVVAQAGFWLASLISRVPGA